MLVFVFHIVKNIVEKEFLSSTSMIDKTNTDLLSSFFFSSYIREALVAASTRSNFS